MEQRLTVTPSQGISWGARADGLSLGGFGFEVGGVGLLSKKSFLGRGPGSVLALQRMSALTGERQRGDP